MKNLIKITILLFAIQNAHAAPQTHPQISNLGEGWVVHEVSEKSPESLFTGNAVAILNFHESADGPLASIMVHTAPAPAKVKLGDDARAWHKIIFEGPQEFKHSITSEHTYSVNGQWRYIVEYSSDTGTMLNTLSMATVINGQFYLVTFDQHRPEFIKLVGSVREMLKSVNITAPSADDKKPVATLKKSDKT